MRWTRPCRVRAAARRHLVLCCSVSCQRGHTELRHVYDAAEDAVLPEDGEVGPAAAAPALLPLMAVTPAELDSVRTVAALLDCWTSQLEVKEDVVQACTAGKPLGRQTVTALQLAWEKADDLL
eukprot:PLAT13123.1.p1 GENE.PLAT13123.1~~PLAT13123.1.p1  ORF type:complete len:123 (-),score=36.12 PLAT13123.1:144-512(-)